MTRVFPPLLAALLLVGCGDDELPPMVNEGLPDNARAEELFQRAREAEDAGRTGRAIKIYDEIGDEIPLAKRAPEARFRQAKLLEQDDETIKAFDAYQQLLARYQGSGYYREALARQSEVAFAAADGEIRNNFFGLRSRLSHDKVAGMLSKVASNAPRSRLAARAETKIADLQVERRETDKAVRTYRGVVENYPNTPEAPEAAFAIGKALLDQARRGNQDQANLDRAEAALRDYLAQYPGHKRNSEARKLLKNIGSRDLQNSYDIAVFYEEKGQLSSARFYYEDVIQRAGSGRLHDKARARLDALGSN